MFYYYRQEPKVHEVFDHPTDRLREALKSKLEALKPINTLTYVAHLLINGLFIHKRERLSREMILSDMMKRLTRDYEWAQSKRWRIEIQLCNHIEDDFGVSLRLCAKHLDASEEDPYIALEQIALRKTKDTFILWRYSDEDVDEDVEDNGMPSEE